MGMSPVVSITSGNVMSRELILDNDINVHYIKRTEERFYMASRQQRLNPSKLLVLLLYGTYPYCDVTAFGEDAKKLTLKVGKFARLMRVRNSNIVEYLQWLDEMGFITVVEASAKEATVILCTPTLFSRNIQEC